MLAALHSAGVDLVGLVLNMATWRDKDGGLTAWLCGALAEGRIGWPSRQIASVPGLA